MTAHGEFVVCIIAIGLVLGVQGLQLTVTRTPGSSFCGHIQCSNESNADGNIFTTTSISIYDVTQPDSRIRLASVSANVAGVFINQAKVNDINGTGSVTRYHADLSLDLRNATECTYGSFQCELEFVNKNGEVEVSQTQTSAPGDNNGSCSCAQLTAQLTQLAARFDAVEKELPGLKANQSALEAELNSLRQQNTILDEKYYNISQQISSIQNASNASQGTTATLTTSTTTPTTTTTTPPTITTTTSTTTTTTANNLQSGCYKGMPHNTIRQKFQLWGNVVALCDAETDGGGWVVIQRRTKGDMDFYKGWPEYKTGFGTPDTDFWIGNDIIHNLTAQGYNEFRVDMELAGRKYYAHYSLFNVDSEILNYRLTISGYSGSAGDSMSYHNGMMFTTVLRDNDKDFGNCATHHTSAWWYNTCYRANLNGVWGKNGEGGVIWYTISSQQSLSFTEMKVRLV